MKNVLITGGTGLVGSAIKTISKDYELKYNFIYVERKMCDLLGQSHEVSRRAKNDFFFGKYEQWKVMYKTTASNNAITMVAAQSQ